MYERRSPYKDKAGSALIAFVDLENIMTLVFSGFSFISPFGTPPCQVIEVLLQIFRCYVNTFTHGPLAGVIWKLRPVSLVVTRIWYVIDIDKEK